MREILFRAKRKDNGEWVKGFYVKTFASLLENIILPVEVDADENQDTQRIEFDIYYEVIPETVGQYTGLTDKNGLKIFEFDICKYGDYIVVVDFDEQDSRFTFVVDKNVKADFNYIQEKDLKVIGNIFDNPELLKGVTEQ